MYNTKRELSIILDLAKSNEKDEKTNNLEILIEVIELKMLRQLEEVKEQERMLQEDLKAVKNIKEKIMKGELI